MAKINKSFPFIKILIIAVMLFVGWRVFLTLLGKSVLPTSDEMSTYTNSEFGYAIDFPSALIHPELSEARSREVPPSLYKIIQDGRTSYISIMNSLEKIDRDTEFQIKVLESRDEPLEDQVKKAFGPDCKIKNQTPSSDKGGYDIFVSGGFWAGPGEPPDNSEACSFFHYNRLLRYYPEKNILIDVRHSPEFCNFYSEQQAICLDEQVKNSLRLIAK